MTDEVIKTLQEYTKYAEDIVKRLESLSYTVTSDDAYFLKFTAEKVENHIKNVCNISEIPDGLKNVYVDMVCGEFLQFKYNTNQLDDTNFNIDDAVSVSLGDASVNFGTDGSNTSKFTALTDNLINGKAGELVCYRKIRW
ncbi:hypothetical protein [uncultured Phascolarctobacterium sp.]|uniref:hypothetical protein n=1 Tax=uncultured Phascolarctobacterium sp. TaxID=512296 RepID=UPI0027D9B95C|nr:hypothetical protein [uncultured Phascolarctobacterium sp.]